MMVTMLVDRALLEEILDLGDRHLLGVRETRDQRLLVLLIDAPDAPPHTISMEPMYQVGPDGRAHMTEPGWR